MDRLAAVASNPSEKQLPSVCLALNRPQQPFPATVIHRDKRFSSVSSIDTATEHLSKRLAMRLWLGEQRNVLHGKGGNKPS